MKELFRERELIKVSFYQQLLEAEGIATMIRNEHLTMSGLTEIPIPEFFPALCVLNDDDYEAAMEIIRTHLAADKEAADTESPCPSCGESNPDNFDICWSCEKPLG